ncbi:MAG TPA: transcriptional regulator [Acidobacteriaceae bacterium]|nr:transcriptional regulator [Acidobacteriaceae bacterium]
MSLNHNRIYGFAEFRLQVNARILERDGARVPLGAKAFEVLTCLVMDAGQVVTKDTLLKTVWPEAFVTEANLAQQIFALRKAFGDRASYIVTVPGRGYQFTEQVRELRELPPADQGPVVLQRTTERTRIVIEDTTETSTLVAGMSSLPSALEALRTHSRTAPEPSAAFQAIVQYVTSESASSPAQADWIDRRLPAVPDPPAPRRPSGVTIGIVAVAAILMLLAGRFVARRDAPTPHATRRVVIAEFENHTSDPEFNVALRKALEIDLSQSAYLDVVSEPDMQPALPTALSASAARELCQRSNRQVLITGSVETVAQVYLLSIEANDCESGRLLASTKTKVANKEQMLDAMDTASLKLREALGEPDKRGQLPSSPAAQ